METMADFIFLGSKNTADSDCSQEIKRRLLLGRKALTNLDRVLKCRDITLPKKVHIVTGMLLEKTLTPWKKSYEQPRQCIKRQRHHFADKEKQ